MEPWDDDDDLVARTRRDGRTRMRVTRPDAVSVVLGRGSDPARELRPGSWPAGDVRMARRRGGGCAVVLDPGNVIVSVAARTPGLGAIRLVFDACTRWIVAALSRAGVPAVGVEGVSDLVIGDRKVGGSAIHRSRGLVYFSSTILVAPRVDLMERFLAHPPREPAYRRGRDHASFVGDVSGAAPGLDARTLTRRLAEELTSGAAPLPSSRPR